MKLPKWKTEPIWAIRRAVRKKEKLPEEVERLFEKNPSDCIAYATAINSEIPRFLIDAVCDYYCRENQNPLNNKPRRDAYNKSATNWVLSYALVVGNRIDDCLIDLFVNSIREYIDSNYSWGASRTMQLCKILNGNINQKLEELIWNFINTAISYSTTFKKRIPEELEEKILNEVHGDKFVEYAKIFFKEEIPKNIESVFIKKPAESCEYAEHVLFGKLPEHIHSSLVMLTFSDCDKDVLDSIKSYLKFVDKMRHYTKRVLAEFDKNDTVEYVLEQIGDSQINDS